MWGYNMVKWCNDIISYIPMSTHTHIYIYYTSSAAQGGGGSFKNRKPIGEVGCCESRMAERTHCWTVRWLELCFLERLHHHHHQQHHHYHHHHHHHHPIANPSKRILYVFQANILESNSYTPTHLQIHPWIPLVPQLSKHHQLFCSGTYP